MTTLREAFDAEAQGIPALGDIDAAIATAEREGRRWRWAGVAVAVAAAIALVVWTQGLGMNRADRLPTAPPSPSAWVLAADPLLTEDGWASWWGADNQSFTRESVDPPLLQCIGDVRSLGGEVHSATFHHLYSAEANNEFVLRYPDPALAARAFAELRNQFTDCHPGQAGRRPFIEPWPVPGSDVAPEGPIDAMIVGSASASSHGDFSPFGYGILAAREGNVIVILESFNPSWGERQSPLMMALLDQALGPDWQTRP